MYICCRSHGKSFAHRVGTSHEEPEGRGGIALGQVPEVCQVEGVLVAVGLQAVAPLFLPGIPVSAMLKHCQLLNIWKIGKKGSHHVPGRSSWAAPWRVQAGSRWSCKFYEPSRWLASRGRSQHPCCLVVSAGWGSSMHEQDAGCVRGSSMHEQQTIPGAACKVNDPSRHAQQLPHRGRVTIAARASAV